MKKFHVTAFYVHASGIEWVSVDRSDILFVRAYGVGTTLVDLEWADLHFTPFGEIHLRKLSDDQLNRHPSLVDPYLRFWHSLTKDDWLDTTTTDVIVLPVSSIDFREWREGTYMDMLDFLRTPVAVG